MAKPIVKSIEPFDINVAVDDVVAIINFSYSGNQPYNNKLTIYDGKTLEVVGTHIYETRYLKNNHVITSEMVSDFGLENGKQYAAVITCYDINDVASADSDKVFFWTMTTPSFGFEGIVSGENISSSSVNCIIDYSQIEGEKLSQTKFYLYSADKIELSSTEIIYGSSDIAHTFVGLENTTTYFLRATGQTEHGKNLDTGYVQIFVKYENPGAYALIYANEDSNGTGTVNYYTNMSVIKSTRDDYDIVDGHVDIIGDWLTYDSGFSLDGDFSIALKYPFKTGEVLELSNDQRQKITMSLENIDGFYVFMLNIDDQSRIFSDPIDACDGENITDMAVWLKRKNGLYDIDVVVDYMYKMTDFKIWYTEDEPEDAINLDHWLDSDTFEDPVEEKDISTDSEEPSDADVWIGGD